MGPQVISITIIQKRLLCVKSFKDIVKTEKYITESCPQGVRVYFGEIVLALKDYVPRQDLLCGL